MKTITTLTLSILSASAFAGQEIAPPPASGKDVVVPESAFGETELQLDVYGAYVDGGSSMGDGFGGGLAITYFFHRNFGFTIDTNASDADSETLWQHSAGIVGRYPFEINGTYISPYLKVTGGIQSQDDTDSFFALGGGIEWRVNPRLGLFAEATYGFVQDSSDFVNIRTGVRFVF